MHFLLSEMPSLRQREHQQIEWLLMNRSGRPRKEKPRKLLNLRGFMEFHGSSWMSPWRQRVVPIMHAIPHE